MPRLLAIGHVTWDRREGADVLGGSVCYATLAARALGWDAGMVTRAGPEFVPAAVLPGITVFAGNSAATTRFRNDYGRDGRRTQWLLSRADVVEPRRAEGEWRRPTALLLAPVIDEVPAGAAGGFDAEVVGAIAQGWLRAVDGTGRIFAKPWTDPGPWLAGVHVLFLSQNDVPDPERRSRELLQHVPIVALTRGIRGVTLLTRDGEEHLPAQPRPEVDPTGAGDVFAAAFLVAYAETADLSESAVFASSAASYAVEGVGASCLGDRASVLRRVEERQRFVASR